LGAESKRYFQVQPMTLCRFRLIFLCFTPLLLALSMGCAPRPAEDAGILEHMETYYFDAELAFAIEYPSDWKLERGSGRPPESCTVYWQSSKPEDHTEPVVRAAVVACPLSHWSGGAKAMQADFLAERPALGISEKKEVALPGGKATMLLGNDASRGYLAVFLDTESRGYILTFSTPGSEFEGYRPLFEEVLESFQPQRE
jgi:hypothetical protein